MVALSIPAVETFARWNQQIHLQNTMQNFLSAREQFIQIVSLCEAVHTRGHTLCAADPQSPRASGVLSLFTGVHGRLAACLIVKISKIRKLLQETVWVFYLGPCVRGVLARPHCGDSSPTDHTPASISLLEPARSLSMELSESQAAHAVEFSSRDLPRSPEAAADALRIYKAISATLERDVAFANQLLARQPFDASVAQLVAEWQLTSPSQEDINQFLIPGRPALASVGKRGANNAAE